MCEALPPFIRLDEVRLRSRFVETLFDTMSNGVVFSRAIQDEHGDVVDFQVVDCNDALCRMTGFSREMMRLQTMRQQDPDADKSGIFERWKEAYTTNEPTRLTHYFKGADVWLEQSLSRFDDGIIACFTDVTYLKRTEAQTRRMAARHERLNKTLQKQNDLLASVLNQVRCGVVVHDAVLDGSGQVLDFRLRLQNDYMKDLCWQTFRNTMSPGELFLEGLGTNQVARPLYALMEKAFKSNRPQHLTVSSPQNLLLDLTFSRFGASVLTTTSERR